MRSRQRRFTQWLAVALTALAAGTTPVAAQTDQRPRGRLGVQLSLPKPTYSQGEEVLVRVTFTNTSVTREAGSTVFVPPVIRPLSIEIGDITRGSLPPAYLSPTPGAGLRLQFGRQPWQGQLQYFGGGAYQPLVPVVPPILTAPFSGELRHGESAEADFSLLAEEALLPIGAYRFRLSFAANGGVVWTDWATFSVFALPGWEREPRLAFERVLAADSPEQTVALGRAFVESYPHSQFVGRVRRRAALAAQVLGDWQSVLDFGLRLLSPKLQPMGQWERDTLAVAVAEALWRTGNPAAAERLLFSITPALAPDHIRALRRFPGQELIR